MPFVEEEIGGDYEARPVPEGRYKLRVKEFDAEWKSKKGGEGRKAVVEIVSGEDGSEIKGVAAPIILYLMKPDGGDYDDMRRRDLKRFLTMFSVPFDAKGFDSDDVVGSEAVGLITTEDNEEYGPQNRLTLPKVEAGEAAAKKPARRR